MITVRRLQGAGLGLAILAAIACSVVWGEPAGRGRPADRLAAIAGAIKTDGAATPRFDGQSVVTYQPRQGDLYFAAQLKPQLPAAHSAGRDLMVLIDTSASQAGMPFKAARQVLRALLQHAGADDRVSCWVINLPEATRELVRGFQPANAPEWKQALESLDTVEYASGATDLRHGINKALDRFEGRDGRKQVILYLGDGESAYQPLTDADRYRIAEDCTNREVVFVSVPLGLKLNPKNLHGLPSGTGGTVVRLPSAELADAKADADGDKLRLDIGQKLLSAVDVPVFYPGQTQLPATVTEAYPTRLPPLRSDAPTLLTGRCQPMTALDLTITGTLAGQPHSVTIREPMSAPQDDAYFLVSMVSQWKASPHTDAPALIRADRALAFASEQTRLSRDEFLTLAHWALAGDKYNDAERLYRAAAQIDPKDTDANTGLEVVRQLRDGKITKKQLRDQFTGADDIAVRIGRVGRDQAVQTVRDRMKALVAKAGEGEIALAQNPGEAGGPAVGGNPVVPGAGGDLLQQEKQRRQIEEQFTQQVVEEALRQARLTAPVDPDAAIDLLKRQLNSVRDNPAIGDLLRQRLSADLEASVRRIEGERTRIRQRQEEEREKSIRARLRAESDLARQNLIDRTRERIRAFSELMNQARFEEAYKEALVLQQEYISKGLEVPIEATAAYNMSLNATNLREVNELKRIREERFLITMLQVEKSAIPYPDEPPVHFPPAQVWRQLTANRSEKYQSTGLDAETPQRTYELRDKMTKPITIERAIERASLKDVLEFLTDKYELTFIVDSRSFKDQGIEAIEDQQVTLQKVTGVSLGTVLRLLLAQINATYLIRRDYVEVTTYRSALSEKAIRVYPVADLVIPIPDSINQDSLNQNLNVLGQTFSFNAQGSQFTNPLAGIGIGGGIGGFGGFGGGLGGLNAGLAQGGLGGGAQGFGGNQFGGVGFQVGGQVNLGAGGGLQGFGGGQLGQFGNLGGQFGFQGGDQSSLLVSLIQQTIARGEWANTPQALGGLQGGNLDGGDPADPPEDEPRLLSPDQLNSLGYYPPARALVVRATSRIHTRLGGGLLGGGGPPVMQAKANGLKDGAVVIAPKKNPALQQLQDLANRGKPAVDQAKPSAKDDPAVAKVDAKKAWQEMLDKFAGMNGGLNDPGLIIAGVDFLAKAGEFEHAAELLKADLRHGYLTDPWVFDALAVALKASGAAGHEVERAQVSLIDLVPDSASAYLKGAEALAKSGKSAQALVFCREAATLEPERADPYVNALVLADTGRGVDRDAAIWAGSNILSRDWARDGRFYHNETRVRLADLERKLIREGRPADAAKLKEIVSAEQHRDLVIELTWQGDADLDLYVKDPTGSVCSVLSKHTPGGGVITGDDFPRTREVYTAAEAFTGTYEVRVNTVWGRPVGNKATLKVTHHQGTSRQAIELFTLELSQQTQLAVSLDAGRRTDVAAVPPPPPPVDMTAISGTGSDQVLNRLREMTDPSLGGTRSGSRRTSVMRGGLGSTSDHRARTSTNEVNPARTSLIQGKVSGVADLATQAEWSADGQSLRLSMTPVFQTAGRQNSPVNLSLIPGGR